jgi:hypothetical protein
MGGSGSWALDLGERRTPDFRALHSENSEDSTVEDYPCRQALLYLLHQELGDAGSAQTFSNIVLSDLLRWRPPAAAPKELQTIVAARLMKMLRA